MNLKEIQALGDVELRIKVAKLDGWNDRPVLEWDHYFLKRVGHRSVEAATYSDLPDYPNDLNAMHEAEKLLTKDQRAEYGPLISRVSGKGQGVWWNLTHATARQRAEAFVLTLTSKE